jgi:hypothetical protein
MINSNSLGKTRTQVVKKLVFLFGFALVALAYVVTPLTALAGPCPGDQNQQQNEEAVDPAEVAAVTRRARRQQTNRQIPQLPPQATATPLVVASTRISSTNLKQLFVVLKTGTLQFVDTAGNIVNFGTLRPGQVFEITASDTANNPAQNISAKLLGKTLALITLPRNIQQQVLFANIKSPCLSSQTFPINLGGSATPQIGQCLDKNSASVTIPGSSIPTTIVFPQSLKV